MCGRFTQAYTWRELVALYWLTQPAVNLQARYNIAPTTTVEAVIPRGGDRLELVKMRWGLIPSWWNKTAKEVPATFNARAKTVAEKPMFRGAFKRSRCIVPASGYYEWKPTPTGKQPYYISAADSSVLSFAGLWDEWHDVETGEQVKSCSIIVTTANVFAGKIHDRMPVVLGADHFATWLNGSPAEGILVPAPEAALQMWPVSRKVNRVGNDNDSALIEAMQ